MRLRFLLPSLLLPSLLLYGLFGSDSLSALGQESDIAWRIGKEFTDQRKAATKVAWEQVPLDDALQELARAQRVAIFLDRRVDPSKKITFQHPEASLDTVLIALATQLELGVGSVGPVLYLGPPATATMVATLAERGNQLLRDAKADHGGSAHGTSPMIWPQLTEPRRLVQDLAKEIGLGVVNPDVIPHDLWRARSLPPLTTAEKLTLVLSGFDLTFQPRPAQHALAIQRIPVGIKVAKEYEVGVATGPLAKELSQSFPDATFQSHAGHIRVRGTWETHQRVQEFLATKSVNAAPPHAEKERPRAESSRAVKLNTLTVKDVPRKPLLEVLARKLELELVLEDAAAPVFQEHVSISVREVTREVLFGKVLEGSGYAAVFDGSKVTVKKQ